MSDRQVNTSPHEGGWPAPRGPRGTRRPLAERFWEKVDKDGEGGCWNWLATVRRGRGIIWTGGVDGRPVYTHRLVFELMGYGKIPDGLEIDHACRNPRCVNPDHLRAVTPRVNSIHNNHSPFALNRAKTHCKRGHAFDEANTIWGTRNGRPTRQCRACDKLRPSYLKKLKQQSSEGNGRG